MAIQPYLFFEGRCDEAIAFYQQALGATVKMLMRYQDMPRTPGDEGPHGPPEKVMHARLLVGEAELLVSDGRCRGETDFRGFGLSLTAADEAEAARRFNALAEGGAVMMPLGKTFFSPAFRMVSDRFGVLWMVYVPG